MAKSVTISSVSLTEGNPAVSALVPAYTYLRDMSVVNFSFTCKWSGFSKVTYIEATVGLYNSASTYQQSAWLFAKEEKTTATSGTKTYSGQMFVPQLSSGYSPGLTSLADGTYWIKFDFTVWNGSSGDGQGEMPTYCITYATMKAPSAQVFDVYRTTSAGAKSDEGTYLRYSVNAAITPILATDKGTFTLRYRQSGTSTWSTIALGSGVTSVNVSAAQLPVTCPISNSYELELVITDRYTTVTIPKVIPTGSVLMHFKADKTGIGIGKYAETSNLLDVNLTTKFRQPVNFASTLSFDNQPSARSALGFGGLSCPIYTDVRVPVETYCHLPVNLAQSAYDNAVITPTMINSAAYNYAYRVNQSGFYLLAADLRADTSGSDSSTTAHTNLGEYVIASLSELPTTSVSTYIGSVSAQKLCTGVPTSPYRKFNTYMAGCTTTSTTGEVTGVCYIPAGYYVVFMVYFRYSRKDIFSGNVGMALLR